MSDDALIEAMALAMLKSGYSSFWSADDLKGMAHHALAVCRPIIEAPLLERLDAFEMDGASCANEVKRLRAENEKLHEQAAINGRLLTENSELREENRLVGLQMDRMADEIEKLRAILSNVKLSIEAFDPAAALKETDNG